MKGPTPSEKRCAECDIVKPVSEFYRAGEYMGSYCKPCSKARTSAWQRNNKDRVAARNRRSMLKTQYGLSEADYESMLRGQGGACAICLTRPLRGQVLAVDHCHATGVVRGLLCSKCNTGIGFMRDDTERLRKALTYLRQLPRLF